MLSKCLGDTCDFLRNTIFHPMVIMMSATFLSYEFLAPPPAPPPDPARFDGMIAALTCSQSQELLLQSLRGDLSDRYALEDAVSKLTGETPTGGRARERGKHKMDVSLQAAAASGLSGRRLTSEALGTVSTPSNTALA
jgi:hypothetical protein